MKVSGRVTKIVFVFILTISFFLASCEPLITIHVQNQTDDTLLITIDDVFMGKAIPGGEVKKQEEVIYSYYTVVAKDMSGNVVYTANFTREDISGKKTFRVIIPETATVTQ